MVYIGDTWYPAAGSMLSINHLKQWLDRVEDDIAAVERKADKVHTYRVSYIPAAFLTLGSLWITLRLTGVPAILRERYFQCLAEPDVAGLLLLAIVGVGLAGLWWLPQGGKKLEEQLVALADVRQRYRRRLNDEREWAASGVARRDGRGGC